MAERVREDRALDSRGLGVLGEKLGKASGTHAETVLREEECALARVFHELEAAFTKVKVEGGDSLTGERHDAIFLSFAAPNEKKLLGEIDVGDVEPQTLAAAEAGAVEDLEDGAVAFSVNARARGRVHEPARFRFREHATRKPNALRSGKLERGILEKGTSSDEPGEEPANDVEITALSSEGERGVVGAVLLRDFGQVACEAEEMELANREDVSDSLAM
jgi:hypothetical protein